MMEIHFKPETFKDKHVSLNVKICSCWEPKIRNWVWMTSYDFKQKMLMI